MNIGEFFPIILVVLMFGGTMISVILFNVYTEGIETTVTGTVQLYVLKYDKSKNIHYTSLQLRSTRTRVLRLILLDHHSEFELGKTYRITYVRTNIWAYLIMRNRVISSEELPPPQQEGI